MEELSYPHFMLDDIIKLNIEKPITSSSYGRVFCLDSQKIDGTEF